MALAPVVHVNDVSTFDVGDTVTFHDVYIGLDHSLEEIEGIGQVYITDNNTVTTKTAKVSKVELSTCQPALEALLYFDITATVV